MSEDNRTPKTLKPARTPLLVPMEKTAIFPEGKGAALLRAACFDQPTGITGYWTPTTGDLDGVEAGLEKFLEEQGRKPQSDWSRHFRQVAGLRQDGERTLFLSYFVIEAEGPPGTPAGTPDSAKLPERWKQEAFWNNDGGDTFFRVIYDPSKREFIWYERNRDA